jgi:hypothetical protein
LSVNKVFLIFLSQDNIFSISTQIKAKGNNQTFVNAENLQPIQSGREKTSYHFFTHFFSKSEFSPAIIVKCFIKSSFSFLTNFLKKLN